MQRRQDSQIEIDLMNRRRCRTNNDALRIIVIQYHRCLTNDVTNDMINDEDSFLGLSL